MEVYRIKISSWTASFRFPNIISGIQPSLEVPPISTVLGIFNAAAGKYIEFNKLKIGYCFKFESKGNDLETIYQIELSDKKVPKNVVKPNIINREFLFNCTLYIYLQNDEYIEFFRQPYYSILLGRSSDIATVEKIDKISMEFNNTPTNIKGQIIPFNGIHLPGLIQPLPKYFTNTVPRKNLGTEPYTIIAFNTKIQGDISLETYTDFIENSEVDIFFHELDFSGFF